MNIKIFVGDNFNVKKISLMEVLLWTLIQVKQD